MRSVASLVALGGLVLGSTPVSAQEGRSGALPLVRLKLYETGVGYFERKGTLQGSLKMAVPATHLDDALNTMVVWNEGGTAHVERISFSSTVTEDRRRDLAGLPRQGSGELSFGDLLQGMMGTRVRVQTKKETEQGRLFRLLKGEKSGLPLCSLVAPPGKTEQPEFKRSGVTDTCVLDGEQVAVIVDGQGSVERILVRNMVAIQPLDRAHVGRLSRASESDAESERTLSIFGKAKGPVTLGYIAESPLWRASYRAVFSGGADDEARLQGWALVHNDTEEPWKGLAIELVSGQPDSFLFPFAAPRYHYRRLVTPEQELPSVRQLGRSVIDDLWDQGTSPVLHGSGGGYGYGSGHGGLSALRLAPSKESKLINIGDLAALEPSQGQATGAVYRYELAKDVNLAPYHSAFLPLFDESASMKRVTLFEPGATSGKSVLVLKNTTRQTLPAGVLSVYQGDTFVGETALPRLNVGEQGRAPFGLDLDVSLRIRGTHVSEKTRLLRYASSNDDETINLDRHYVKSTVRRYLISNRSSEARAVHLQLDVVNNSRVDGADRVIVSKKDEATFAHFLVKAGEEREVTVTTDEGRRNQVRDVDLVRLKEMVETPELLPDQTKPMRRVIQHMERHVVAKRRFSAIGRAIERKEGQLLRLRADAKVLGKLTSPTETAQIARDIRSVQKRITALEKRRAAIHLDAQKRAIAAALRAWNALSD